MLQQHCDSGADVTVACLEVTRAEASAFGVMHVDETDRIVAFVEKPADPPSIPGNPDVSLASLGIYVFRTSFLFEQLRRDAATPGSSRDFGKDIIPIWSSTAKPGRTASPPPASARMTNPARTGAMSARSTPIGRPAST